MINFMMKFEISGKDGIKNGNQQGFKMRRSNAGMLLCHFIAKLRCPVFCDFR